MPDITEFPTTDPCAADESARPGEEVANRAGTRRSQDANPIEVDQKDPLGYIVKRIFLRMDSFDIYESGDKVRYCLKVERNTEKDMRSRLYPFLDDLCMVEDMVCSMKPFWCWGNRKFKYDAFKQRVYDIIAKIMASALDGEPETAQNLIDKLTRNVEMRRDSQNRMRYIYANLGGFVAFLTTALLLHLWPLVANLTVPTGVQALNVVTMGILGAFFSVAIGVNKVRVKHSITVAEMLYTGFIRIPIGIIAAIVVIVLIEGNWILSALDPGTKTWSLYLFGFLAGFSELFIPNALKQVEGGTSVRSADTAPAPALRQAPPQPAA